MSDAKPKSKIRHKVRWWFIVLLSSILLFFLAVAGGAVYLAHEVFQESPLPPEMMTTSPEDMASVQKKVQPLIMKVLQSAPGQVAEMRLTGGEINAAISIAGSYNVKWPQGFAVKFEDRQLICDYSRKMTFNTPFGSYINTRALWQPDVHNGNIDFKIASLRVGNQDVKPSWVKSGIIKELEKNPEEIKRFKKIIVDLYVNADGLLVVRYYPYEIKLIVQEVMARNFNAPAK